MEQILKKYNIGNIKKSKKFKDHVILIETEDEQYILKEKKFLEKTLLEHKLLRKINQKLQLVSQPILTKDYQEVVKDNSKIYALYSFVDGKSIENHFEIDNIDETMFEYGKAIARLHEGLRNCQDLIEKKDSRLIDYIDRKYLEYIPSLVDVYDNLPQQLIHRDLHPNNLLFEEGKVCGVIDFEIYTYGPRIFDLAYCFTALLTEAYSDEKLLNQWIDMIAPLIKGYESHTPLTILEKQFLIEMMMMNQSIYVTYFEKQENNKLADENRQILIWLKKHNHLHALFNH